MQRPSTLPVIALGVLALSVAGAAALGVAQAPSGADLAVHNGAGQTLAAARMAGYYTGTNLGGDTVHFRFTSPDRVTASLSGPTKASTSRQTLTGTAARKLLEPVRELLSVGGFTGAGPTYSVVEPVAQLLPQNEQSLVTGTYRATVQVTGGYVVSVNEHIVLTARGRSLDEKVRYHLTRVGSWNAP